MTCLMLTNNHEMYFMIVVPVNVKNLKLSINVMDINISTLCKYNMWCVYQTTYLYPARLFCDVPSKENLFHTPKMPKIIANRPRSYAWCSMLFR